MVSIIVPNVSVCFRLPLFPYSFFFLPPKKFGVKLTLFSLNAGKLETLKHIKKDVTEMRKGGECGMGFQEFQDIQVGDQIQAYEEVVTKRSL
jgi:hypothetical protein